MWTREELKRKAKMFLKTHYLPAFFVSFVLMIVTGSGGNFRNENKISHDPALYINNAEFNPDAFWHVAGPIVGIGALVFVALILLRIFIGYILEVGARNYFLRGTEREVTVSEMAFGFNSEYYGNIVKTMFIKGLYNLLWFLLLIIPGIIKAYAYSMVPYILADNPNIDSDRAIELSIKMTGNQKWDMFVLDLSFIGWYLLGSLLFGIGTWFVNPYVDATKAQLYSKLRLNAVRSNLCTPEELCFKPDEDVYGDSENWYDQY